MQKHCAIGANIMSVFVEVQVCYVPLFLPIDYHIMTFATLGLSEPLLKAISEQDYDTPTPVQLESIPAVISGRDVMAAAQTGTGKTAGFTLPILHRLASGEKAKANQARVLILTPTRELAAQIAESVATYGKYVSLSSTVVFGGVNINPQMKRLRSGTDILVATPGRLLDLHQQNAIKFTELEVLVLDEADRMLDMGFIHDIRRILKVLPVKRQNLMFSATFSADIRQLAKTIVNDPVEISVAPPNSTTNLVTQWIYPVEKTQKAAVLTHLIKSENWHQVLVFSRTKHGANKLSKYLEDRGIKAAAIHGNKSQAARTKALAGFKSGDVQALVATDIAARGIDIDQLPQVVNVDLPHVPEDYVHRIGRTGRAGSNGQAVSLVSTDELKQLRDIERLIQKRLDRRELEGFVPAEALPDTGPIRAPRIKRPKKAKPQGSGSAEQSSRDGRGSGGRNNNNNNSSSNSNRSGASNRNAHSASRPARSNTQHSRSGGANTKVNGNIKKDVNGNV